MKNCKRYLLIFFGLGVIGCASANASFLAYSKALVSMGVTDRPTVKHNIDVYLSIIDSIEDNIENKKYVTQALNDLKSRVKRQMSVMGFSLSEVIAPEVYTALSIANKAVYKNDLNALRRSVKIAKKQLIIVQKGI